MKGLDLKSVNVQELNDDELRQIDGGCAGLGALIAFIVLAAIGISSAVSSAQED